MSNTSPADAQMSEKLAQSLAQIFAQLNTRREAARSRSSGTDYWRGFEWGLTVAVSDIARALEDDGIITAEDRSQLVDPFTD